MGGVLSGRYVKRKRTVEEFPFLNICKLKGVLKNDTERITLQCTINDMQKDQVFYLEWIDCNFGGKRPFFICSECGCRTTKLYYRHNVFLCRTCQNLTYRRTQIAGDKIAEVDWKIRKLYKRLGMEGAKVWDHTETPREKPKNMQQKTYMQLQIQLMRLQEERHKAWISGAKTILNKQ